MDRHCWGCRKRRVVCDLGKPGCAKCKRAGVECQGYGKQKPLQWLEVGKVKCREKKKRNGLRMSAAVEEFEESDEPEAFNSTTPRASPKGKERALSPIPHRPMVEADVERSVSRLGIKDETIDIVQAIFYCELSSMVSIMFIFKR